MQYRYFLTGRSGTRQVFPSNDGTLEFTYEKESNRADFTRELDGSIILNGQDFKWLYEQELLVYRFSPLTLNIHKRCKGSWNEDWFEGMISLNSGEWDIDKCKVALTVDKYDKYECFDLNKDTKVDLLRTVYPKVNIKPLEGNIVTNPVTIFPGQPFDRFPGEADPESKGWRMINYRFTDSNWETPQDPSNPLPSDGYGTYNIVWAREEITGDDSFLDHGWIGLGGIWYARPPILYNRQQESYNPSRPNDIAWKWSVLDKEIDNGMSFESVFQQLLTRVCPDLTLESDFFQWNPENISSDNYVTGQLSKVNNMVLFQKSDIKRPYISGSSNRAEITFDDLLEDICNMFQLEWEITDDGKFKIEHISYKNRHQGLDTTRGQNAILNKAKRQYAYDNDSIPKQEVFSFMDNESTGDFQAAPIIYTNPIAGKEKQEEAYAVKNITTDVMLCLENPDGDSKKVSDDGFVLVACSPGFGILRENSIRGGNTANNPLAWAQLHRDYWRHNRFMLNFRMNNSDTVALTVKPIKIQEQVRFQMCCDSDFDTDGLITTALGNNGVLQSATFNLFREIIEMTVAFPAEGLLHENVPPVANNDEAVTFMNTPVVIDVLANDTDEDGVIIPSTLNIVSRVRGTTQIMDDFRVRFIPETGFTGTASFRYTVRDNLGEISNVAIATITVNPGTSMPVANGAEFIIAKNLVLTRSSGSIQINDTAATAITVVADSGASDQGGTYTIQSNGAFTYQGAADFVGVDTFPYTIRDNYGNEAIGVTTINVFEPETVYVRMDQQDDHKFINENCGMGGMTNVGDETRTVITIGFFSDPNGAEPLDVTGYNMVLKMRQRQRDYIYNTDNQYVNTVVVGAGDEFTYGPPNGMVTRYTYYGCGMTRQMDYEVDFSLDPDPAYIIIT